MIFDAYTNWLGTDEALNSWVSATFRIEFVPLVKINKCAEICIYKITVQLTSTPFRTNIKNPFICNDLYDLTNFKLGGNNLNCMWRPHPLTSYMGLACYKIHRVHRMTTTQIFFSRMLKEAGHFYIFSISHMGGWVYAILQMHFSYPERKFVSMLI